MMFQATIRAGIPERKQQALSFIFSLVVHHDLAPIL
jgi:hypothetical protein